MEEYLKKKFHFLKEIYWETDSIWLGGYFIATIGASRKIICK